MNSVRRDTDEKIQMIIPGKKSRPITFATTEMANCRGDVPRNGGPEMSPDSFALQSYELFLFHTIGVQTASTKSATLR